MNFHSLLEICTFGKYTYLLSNKGLNEERRLSFDFDTYCEQFFKYLWILYFFRVRDINSYVILEIEENVSKDMKIEVIAQDK